MQKSPALITSDLCPRDGQNSKENIVIEFELLRDAGVLIVAPKETSHS